MNFLYLTNSRLPGEKAHAIQIMKTCAALAAHADVRIIHARRSNRPWLRSVTDMRAFYDLPRDVSRRAIPSLDFFHLVPRLSLGSSGAYRIVFAIQMLTYHLALIPLLLRSRADVYYTRDSLTAALLIMIGKDKTGKVFFEAHSFPSSRMGLALQRWLVPRLDGLIGLTELLVQRYLELANPPRTVAVIADAVDIDAFGRRRNAEARQELGVGQNDFLVMYVGQMYAWKGVETLVEAAAFLPVDARIWLVGGTPEELPRIEKLVREPGAGQVKLVGYVPPTQIPTYLAAADVLALPNSGRTPVSRYYTSPLKLFEYMAAERPIIASDLPALREIITNEETALLVPPDDANAIAAAVERLRADPALARRLAVNARRAAAAHTWEQRAIRILELIQRDDDPVSLRLGAQP
jgi:glycosyltransferase involved in cell wall biosynthesis